MADERPYGRLLRWGLPRNPQAVPHLVGMLVAAAATVLITRAGLALAGYPQVGGRTLHIAHVLWGGLLMIVAMALLLSFVGPVVRPISAMLGGIGFGLFIDEVGKFVTNSGDYFYRPAPAIMYLVLVLLALGINAVHGRRSHHKSEYLAGALDQAVAAIAGGFTDERRAEAQRLAQRGSGAVGAEQTAEIIAAIPNDPYELADPLQRALDLKRRFFDRFLKQRAVAIVAIVLLVLESAYVVQGLGFQLYARWLPGVAVNPNSASTLDLALGTLTALTSGVLVVVGLIRLTDDLEAGFGFFRHALLVNLLLTRVFQFEDQQFATVLFVLLDLVVLAVLNAGRVHLRHSG